MVEIIRDHNILYELLSNEGMQHIDRASDLILELYIIGSKISPPKRELVTPRQELNYFSKATHIGGTKLKKYFLGGFFSLKQLVAPFEEFSPQRMIDAFQTIGVRNPEELESRIEGKEIVPFYGGLWMTADFIIEKVISKGQPHYRVSQDGKTEID